MNYIDKNPKKYANATTMFPWTSNGAICTVFVAFGEITFVLFILLSCAGGYYCTVVPFNPFPLKPTKIVKMLKMPSAKAFS